MTDARQDKQRLRDTVARMRSQLTPDEVDAASARACNLLVDLRVTRRAEVVALYAAIGSEVDPTQARHVLAGRGVKTLLPRVVDDHIHLSSADDPGLLVAGRHGVPEPAHGSEPFDTVDLVVVPGVAFDLDGGRLGRGGGHYDRLLAALPEATVRVGLAHTTQLVTFVPREEHDEFVDIVVTDRAVHHSDARTRPRDA